jgi:membrane protein
MVRCLRRLQDVFRLRGLTLPSLIARVVKKSLDDRMSAYAAQFAFYAFFSLFSFLLFLTVLLAYVPIHDPPDTVMALMSNLVPQEAVGVVEKEITHIINKRHGALLLLSAIFALWSAGSGVAAIAESTNRAYGVTEGRPFWRIQGLGMLLAAVVVTLLLAAMALLVFGSQLGAWLTSFLGVTRVVGDLVVVVRWLLLFAALVVSTAIIYSVTPDVQQDWRWLTPGALFTVVVWVLAWLPFSYYMHYLSTYSITYGGISAVILLLLWMYLTGFLLLLGAEINAVIEHAAPEGKDSGEKHFG